MTGPATSVILLLALAALGFLTVLTVAGELVRYRLGPHRTDPGVESFMTRVHSWWGLVILFTLALLAGRWGVIALFAFAAFAALREFITFSAKSRADHPALAAAFFLVLPSQFLLLALGDTALFSIFVPVYAYLLLPLLSALRNDPRRFLERISEAQWALMICVYAMSHVPALLGLPLPGGPDAGLLLIVFLVATVQIAELGDVFFGRAYGRHRIAPAVSPRTWEGVGAAIVLAMAMAALFHWITPFGPLGAALMAAASSATALAGGLILSTIKREKGIRDWSHLIPGHGGILDQWAGTAFAAPVFYYLTRAVLT